ncbi:MAG: tetratricopeptide repeat protein [Roseibium sp.]|uniref:tetratricopeptide repeat protein n=1 Tax=Roseibium sp. TaxID=1936156 RepID=UPI001B0C817C|nr:tetratricopeptide repeat protein [Roseibium sp.]MBO6893617.1 tetratricopeptide repeat protein [Roseibium sp.]MBO6928112.1 tetratricopeptide repeat protein [Roseibium sp.]
MQIDAYGNALGTRSDRARDAYDLGVKRFLGAEPGVADAFNEALEADEGFALAHIGIAREMQLRSRPDLVKASLARARELVSGSDAREKSHVNASALLLQGKSAEARAAVYEHVEEWPSDVMVAQMCTSVFGLIGFSGLPGREAEQLAYIAALAPHYGDNWWFRAQLAFAQLEVGQLTSAEKNIDLALAANPDSAHSAHIRAHAYYEHDQDEEGLRYLSSWLENYGPAGTLFNHVAWHVGLWSLETGNTDRMWEVIDTQIDPEVSQGPPLNILTDATALLFRAELLGLDVPVERWKRVADYALARFPKTGLAFADVHAAIAFARSGDREALENVVENAGGPAGDLTRTLATGYREMEDGNWGRAASQFELAMRDHARIGGSNAQRDLIDFSLAACLIRDGRRQEARTVLTITRPRAIAHELVAGL